MLELGVVLRLGDKSVRLLEYFLPQPKVVEHALHDFI
jgi:hypothetical protein